MEKLILGLLISAFININSINAQPLKLGAFTFGNNRENKISETPPLKKQDFITEEQDKNDDLKADVKNQKAFRKIHKKEIRKTKRLGKKYESNHALNAGRRKEKIGL